MPDDTMPADTEGVLDRLASEVLDPEALPPPETPPHLPPDPDPILPPAWAEIMSRPDVSHMTLDTLRGDMRRGILDRLRAMPKPWTVMSEMEQSMLINSIDSFTVNLLGQALLLLSGADAFEKIEGLLIKTETKGQTIKTQVDFSRSLPDHARLSLDRAVTRKVMLLLIDTEDFMGEREPDGPDPDEPKLPIEPTDANGGTVHKLRGRRKKDI